MERCTLPLYEQGNRVLGILGSLSELILGEKCYNIRILYVMILERFEEDPQM